MALTIKCSTDGLLTIPKKQKCQSLFSTKTHSSIKLAVAVGDLPNSTIVNGEHVGFDIELIKTFAQRKDYNLKINTMEFGALIAALVFR
ncbi:MAG: transporter substrate-binding domain-containing protein [Melioribacteraceae bacterium]|nr:transporter substrate-binding domain-containing protein [Melioribacteraceae bacterium]